MRIQSATHEVNEKGEVKKLPYKYIQVSDGNNHAKRRREKLLEKRLKRKVSRIVYREFRKEHGAVLSRKAI